MCAVLGPGLRHGLARAGMGGGKTSNKSLFFEKFYDFFIICLILCFNTRKERGEKIEK